MAPESPPGRGICLFQSLAGDYADGRLYGRVEEAADKWSFVAQSLGLEWKENPDKSQEGR